MPVDRGLFPPPLDSLQKGDAVRFRKASIAGAEWTCGIVSSIWFGEEPGATVLTMKGKREVFPCEGLDELEKIG